MAEPVKGTVRGKTIELERTISLPDGSAVLVSIEPVPLSEEERRRRIIALKGTWRDDTSLGGIFKAIEKERRMYRGREVRLA